MDSLVGYGSDDDNENDRYETSNPSVSRSGGRGNAARHKEDDTNYDDVNMDLSEESQTESEPELPPADEPPRRSGEDKKTNESRREVRERERERDGDRRRDEPARRDQRPDKHSRHDRDKDGDKDRGRRGLLGDRPDVRSADKKMLPVTEAKALSSDQPPSSSGSSGRSYDARDAVSPRFAERRDRDARENNRDRDRDNNRDRERERDRHSKDSRERKGDSREKERDNRDGRDRRHRYDDKRSERAHPRSRSRSKGSSRPPPEPRPSAHTDRRVSPPSSSGAEYRHTSYKVNKKLEVMEKMGLQIKTPDGSMATAQQLRQAANAPSAPAPAGAPPYFGAATARPIDQKRKLLWSNKSKSEAEEAAKWSGARFAADSDGRQASKFMRLMGIKDPAAVEAPAAATADPIKKQEELFSAMQQQYEVARATTHTMRGVGLGFQRGPV